MRPLDSIFDLTLNFSVFHHNRYSLIPNVKNKLREFVSHIRVSIQTDSFSNRFILLSSVRFQLE